jgi:hypothetical protein
VPQGEGEGARQAPWRQRQCELYCVCCIRSDPLLHPARADRDSILPLTSVALAAKPLHLNTLATSAHSWVKLLPREIFGASNQVHVQLARAPAQGLEQRRRRRWTAASVQVPWRLPY